MPESELNIFCRECANSKCCPIPGGPPTLCPCAYYTKRDITSQAVTSPEKEGKKNDSGEPESNHTCETCTFEKTCELKDTEKSYDGMRFFKSCGNYTKKKETEEHGRKNDSGKLRWDLVQPLILQQYVRVLTEGANKYAPHNWRKVPDQRNRYFAALLRHIWAWWLGERNDPEWGIHHLAHAMCCLTFLAEPELEAALQKCQHLKNKWVPHQGWRCNECGEVLPETKEEPPLQTPPPDVPLKNVIAPNSPESMGRQLAVELEAAKNFGAGVISEELGRRLLTLYGWIPKGANSWQKPYDVTIRTTEEALKIHGYRLAEDVVESDHGLCTDTGRIRESSSTGQEGSGR
jgi:dATP/dGTP diphosphohydrolase, N-terminal